MADMTNEFILKFLDLYEDEPVIWNNSSHPTNKNRHEVYEAWRRIHVKLGGKYSIEELKKKKESLMASFRHCRSKIKQSMVGGAGPHDVYKPSWFAYEKMESFLNKRTSSKFGTNSSAKDFMASHLNENASEKAEDETDNTDPVSDTDDYYRESPLINEIKHEDLEPSELPTSSLNSSTFKPTSQKKRKLSVDNVEQLNRQMDLVYTIPHLTNQEHTTSTKDYCDLYGELLAMKLRNMDELTREIAMNKIDNLLFEMKINPDQHRLM